MREVLLTAFDQTVAFLKTREGMLAAGGVLLVYSLAWIEVFRKAGYGASTALLMLFPGLNVIVFLWLAFWPWPVRREARILRRMKREIHRADTRTDRRVDAA